MGLRRSEALTRAASQVYVKHITLSEGSQTRRSGPYDSVHTESFQQANAQRQKVHQRQPRVGEELGRRGATANGARVFFGDENVLELDGL